jgi:hypothetical protein
MAAEVGAAAVASTVTVRTSVRTSDSLGLSDPQPARATADIASTMADRTVNRVLLDMKTSR